MAAITVLSIAAGHLTSSFVSGQKQLSTSVRASHGKFAGTGGVRRGSVIRMIAAPERPLVLEDNSATLATPVISELEFLPMPSFEECFPHSTKEVRCVYLTYNLYKFITYKARFS